MRARQLYSTACVRLVAGPHSLHAVHFDLPLGCFLQIPAFITRGENTLRLAAGYVSICGMHGGQLHDHDHVDAPC
jgi:hypothetical protein